VGEEKDINGEKFVKYLTDIFGLKNKSDQIHFKRLAPDYSLDKQPNSWFKKIDINGHLDFKVIWQKYIQLHSGIVAPQLGLSTLEDATQKASYLFVLQRRRWPRYARWHNCNS
jgi:hypothetical protein